MFTSTGFQVLSNKSYVASVQKLHPDIAIALGDIPYGSAPGTKRVVKMRERTLEWILELLNENDNGQAVFAPILPIDTQR